VSRRHARLARCPDGGLELSDDGSSNGTYVNGATEPLAVGTVRRVVAGDWINAGAWTRITVTVAPPS
jgi:predicted component of type VI protein secretion system